MSAYLLAALLRLLGSMQTFDDGSGLLPLYTDTAHVQVVWCRAQMPCAWLDNPETGVTEYAGPTLQVSRIPVAWLYAADYNPTEQLDSNEFP